MIQTLTIKYSKYQDDPNRESDISHRTYLLTIDQNPFGTLFVDPDNYTLVWDGIIDFCKIEDEAIYNLPVILSTDKQTLITRKALKISSIQVYFTIKKKKNSFINLDLGNSKQYLLYKKVLKQSDSITFIRYDIGYSESIKKVKYSFTAERIDKAAELALRLPLVKPIKEKLLYWIIAHHIEAKSLIQKINLSSSLSNLSKCLGK